MLIAVFALIDLGQMSNDSLALVENLQRPLNQTDWCKKTKTTIGRYEVLKERV